MGEFFDYIAATDAELSAVHPTIARYELVSVECDVKNSFTGESIGTRLVWELASDTGTPLSHTPASNPDISEVSIKNLDPVTFFRLCEIAIGTSTTTDSIDAFLYPDLRTSPQDSVEICQLPRPLAQALAEITDTDAVAKAWAASEEAQLLNWDATDFVSVTHQFVELARTAIASSRNIFCIMPNLTESAPREGPWWKFW
jgi:hypothetical protein